MLTEAHRVLCDDSLRADYEEALDDRVANGLVEYFIDAQGREWVSESALRLQERTNRKALLQLQEDNRKTLEGEIAALDEQSKKKDEQIWQKEQELQRALHELETLASQKRLDDVRCSELEAALETRTVEYLREVAAMVLVQERREAEHEKQLADRDNELMMACQREEDALRIIRELASRDESSSASSQLQPLPSPSASLLCTVHGLDDPPSPAYSPVTPPLSCTVHGLDIPSSPAYSPYTGEPECE